MRAVKIAGLTLLLAVPVAAQTTIDNFNTNMPAVLSDPPGGSSNTANAAILGGNRGVVVDNLAGAGPTTVNVTGGNLVLTVTATTPDSRGEARLQWDADTDPLVLSTGGFNPGVDLTAGNAGGFVVGFTTSSVGAEIEITVHDDNVVANFSRAARRVAAGGAQLVRIPFSEFRVAGGVGANFADVRAIELTVRSGEGSVSINEFVTSPPVITATKIDAQVLDTDEDFRVDPGDQVRYTVTITNTGNQATTVDLSDTVDVNTAIIAGSTRSTPIARDDQYGWFGNVTLTADGTSSPTLLANDSDPDGDDVDVQSVVSPTAAGGTVVLDDAETGAFTYTPPAGFKGVDSFSYTIVDDDSNTSTATANIQLEGVVWFVDNANPNPPGNGTFGDPFLTLPEAETASGDGDIVFVFTGSSAYDTGTANGYTMSPNEQLLGQGVALVLGGTEIVAAGTAPTLSNADGRGVTLGASSIGTIRGLTIGATQAAKIFGSTFGTLNTDTLTLNGAGQALDLTTGVLAATFTGIASTNSTARGINLDAVTGTLTVSGSTSITDSAQAGIRVVNGGSTYSFGATTLSSTGSGIDLQTNATSTFNFTSLAVTTDAGAGLLASASGTINISGTGNSIAATGGPALSLTSTSLGSGATFSTVSSSGSPTNGIFLDTVAGALTINGGSIATAAGIDFDLNAGSANVTYAGTITNSASRSVEITGRTGGTVTLSGTINDTGTGINVASNTGGTINFSGSSKVVNTGANAAVTLATNAGATINFTGGNLDIDTTSGAGINATAGGVLTVQGTNNSINTGSGTALTVSSTNIGASGLTFQLISSNGAASGIVLANTGASAGLTVSGTGTNNTGGVIQNSTGDGISLSSTRNITLNEMRVFSSNGNNIDASSVTNLTLNSMELDSSNAEGILGSNVTNLVISGGTFNRGGADSEPTCNINGILINNLLGTSTITGATFSRANTVQFRINNSAATTPAPSAPDTLTITGTTWNEHNGPCGGDHLSVNSDTGGNFKLITNASAGENNFGNFTGPCVPGNCNGGGSAVQITINNAGRLQASLTGIDAHNTTTGVIAGTGAGATGTLQFDVFDNTTANGTGFTNTGSFAMGMTCSAGAGGFCEGAFRNNRVIHNAGVGTDATQIIVQGDGTGRVWLDNNVVTGNFQRGLNANSGGGEGTPTPSILHLNVTGNSYTSSDAASLQGMNITTSLSGDATAVNRMCLNLATNTVSMTGGVTAYRLLNRAADVFELQNFGGNGSSTTDIQNWVSLAPKSNVGTPVSVTINQAYTTSAGCELPVMPTP